MASIARGQSSTIPFQAPRLVGSANECFRAALDLDADGDLDALSVRLVSNSLVLGGWVNDGSGRFTPTWTVSVPAGNVTNFQTHLAVGDLDGDGDEDFVLAALDAVGWWLSNGALAPPTLAFVHLAPAMVKDVATVDIEGDGDEDVIVRCSIRAEVLRSEGVAPPTPIASLTRSEAVTIPSVIGELDGTPGPDLALVNGSFIAIYPLPASPVPGLVPSLSIGISAFAEDLGAGDLDADGDVDLIASGQAGGVYSDYVFVVVRRTGPATFAVEPSSPRFGPCHEMADLDGDGDLDVVSSYGSPFGSACDPTVNTRIRYMLNDGAGSFAPAEIFEAFGAVFEPVARDLDGDGRTDLLAGPFVLFGRGPSGLVPEHIDSLFQPDGESILMDHDRDGDLDAAFGIRPLLLFSSAQDVQRTRINRGDGVFSASEHPIPAAPAGRVLAGPGIPGDFDGDGDLDVLVEDVIVAQPFGPPPAPIPMYQPVVTRLLVNVGGGDLVDGGPLGVSLGAFFQYFPQPAGTATIGNTGYPSTAGALARDADGDGDVDVILRRSQPAATQVWWNDGSGSLSAGPVLAGFTARAVAELTGDSFPDLVGTMSPSAGTTCFVLLSGSAVGAFAAPGSSAAIVLETLGGMPNAIYGGLSSSPALFDRDGDGDLDVVTAALDGLRVHTNLGAGSFASSALASPWPSTKLGRVIAADFDLDGIVDLVSDGADATIGAWWKGTASGYAAPVAIGVLPFLAGDIDGDGDQDFVTRAAGQHSYLARWVRNLAFEAPTAGRQVQYGFGLAGSGGFVPVLGSSGVLRPGLPGEVRISNALGGATAVMAFGDAASSTPLLGGTILTNQQFFLVMPLGGPAGAAGAGYLALPWTLPPSFAGLTFYEQVGVIDPAAPQLVALSNGLRVTIGL